MFKEYWNSGLPATESTFRLGLTNSVAAVAVLILALILGLVSDLASMKRRFLFGFALTGIASLLVLPWVPEGRWVIAALIYGLSWVGFAGANVFYDALLVAVAPRLGDRDRVSSLGYGMGYLGGGLLLSLNILMVAKPGRFGLSVASAAARMALATVALWWLVFSLPAFFWVPEPKQRRLPLAAAFKKGLASLVRTARQALGRPNLLPFLLAYFLYIDGIDTVIAMSTDYGLSLGFPASSLLTALLLIQFLAFPAALGYGRLAELWGAKRSIMLGVGAFSLICLGASRLETVSGYYVLAGCTALFLGGVQALSRSLYSRLIPAGQSGAYFSFYNMFGKFSAILGPALMGTVGRLTGNPRLSILSVLALFALGGLILLRVRED